MSINTKFADEAQAQVIVLISPKTFCNSADQNTTLSTMHEE